MPNLIESILNITEIASVLGFLIATITFGQTIRKFAKSLIGSIFFYITISTGLYIFISLFLLLGHGYFGISDDSFDVMWHLMFYVSFMMYYMSMHAIVGMSNVDPENVKKVLTISSGKKFGLSSLILVAILFFAPHIVELVLAGYVSSPLFSFGFHHFLAFGVAGLVAYYVLSAKKNFGSFALSIATPFIITVSALSLQHLWELLNESWKVILVTSEVGEGVEKILVLIAASSLVWGAMRLKKFANS